MFNFKFISCNNKQALGMHIDLCCVHSTEPELLISQLQYWLYMIFPQPVLAHVTVNKACGSIFNTSWDSHVQMNTVCEYDNNLFSS